METTNDWLRLLLVVAAISFSLGWGIGRHFLSKFFRGLVNEVEENIQENHKRTKSEFNTGDMFGDYLNSGAGVGRESGDNILENMEKNDDHK